MYVTLQIKPTLAEIYTDVIGTESASETEGKWLCPMHPEVQSDEFGECSICGMDLVEKAEVSTPAETTASVWVCPMHPEEQSDEFGECSICGMDLVEKQLTTVGTDAHFHAHQPIVRSDLPSLIFKYVCPDNPDEYSTVPGLCPHDGKPLLMTGEVLTVPKSAVIDTGLRKIVFVDRGESGYEQIEIEVGPEAWGISDDSKTKRRYYPIVSGLAPDDIVVTHGNFLIDSQTQLTGAASGAYGGALGGEESKAPVHQH